VEVPVHHYRRVYGSSQFFHLSQLAETIRQLFRLWCMYAAPGAREKKTGAVSD